MPRRFIRHLLVFVIMLSSEVLALGLGEVRLDSALNQPLRADIELLGATPEELTNLTVSLASAETFARYGLDRPFYLQDLVFNIVQSGREDGNYIRIRSASPMTEPFLTFLVEATWSRGRLLREYTVLLDPPTFAPQSATQAQPAITAPQRSTTTDSGRIVVRHLRSLFRHLRSLFRHRSSHCRSRDRLPTTRRTIQLTAEAMSCDVVKHCGASPPRCGRTAVCP